MFLLCVSVHRGPPRSRSGAPQVKVGPLGQGLGQSPGVPQVKVQGVPLGVPPDLGGVCPGGTPPQNWGWWCPLVVMPPILGQGAPGGTSLNLDKKNGQHFGQKNGHNFGEKIGNFWRRVVRLLWSRRRTVLYVKHVKPNGHYALHLKWVHNPCKF